MAWNTPVVLIGCKYYTGGMISHKPEDEFLIFFQFLFIFIFSSVLFSYDFFKNTLVVYFQ